MSSRRIGPDQNRNTAGIPFPASSQSPAQKRGIRGFIGYLISCCPYTMLGKKILRFLRGEAGTLREPPTNRELYLRSQIKIGFGIMLIGVFCPIFWFALLSGVRGNELMFNAVHSGIVILFGLLYIVIYRIQLRHEQVKKQHEKLPSEET